MKAWRITFAAAVSGIAGLAVALAPSLAPLLPPCPLHTVVGVPCASCGSTRALVALAQGRPLEALAFNPLAFFAVLGLPLAALAWALAGGRPELAKLQYAWPWWLRGLVLALLAANWLWVVLHLR